jgi:hypothetical protein
LRDRRHDLSKADIGYLRDLYDEEIAGDVPPPAEIVM